MLVALTFAGTAFLGWAQGFSAGIAVAATSFCLALGFWLTESLIGVMTGVKVANSTAIGLLFLGKLGWWGLVFWLSRHYPPGHEGAIAAGIGAFLLSLLAGVISIYGMPKLSDANAPREP